ncbi:DinB family protein [bacterium]|nr:MAG: DinB family protein [bacterium]
MKFDLNQAIEILERTPKIMESMLSGLSDEWIMNNEGEGTWCPFDIIGHLIHGEKTDWVPRMEIILSDQTDKRFEPFDRFAQFQSSEGKNLLQLLVEFKTLRAANLEDLRSKRLTANDLQKTGVHPAFGAVTLGQLISTWAVHDLTHITQIARVMAKQYKDEVGPWVEYLRVLQS